MLVNREIRVGGFEALLRLESGKTGGVGTIDRQRLMRAENEATSRSIDDSNGSACRIDIIQIILAECRTLGAIGEVS